MLIFLVRRTRWLFMPVLGGLAYLALGLLAPPVLARRFDTPWQSRGAAWTQVPDGFATSSDIAEDMAPWIAEVSVPSVSIYARPSAKEPIRRSAKQGELLRVSGVSPGIEGDTATWWATTEGYVGLHTLRGATSDWAKNWTLPDGSQATSGWWGAIRSQANVRAAPTTGAPVVGTL